MKLRRTNYCFYQEKVYLLKEDLFLLHNFKYFMEKKPCAKFCGVLISFHKVMKLQSFESDVSDVIPVNVQNFSSLFSLHIFVSFMEKEPFYMVLTH